MKSKALERVERQLQRADSTSSFVSLSLSADICVFIIRIVIPTASTCVRVCLFSLNAPQPGRPRSTGTNNHTHTHIHARPVSSRPKQETPLRFISIVIVFKKILFNSSPPHSPPPYLGSLIAVSSWKNGEGFFHHLFHNCLSVTWLAASHYVGWSFVLPSK